MTHPVQVTSQPPETSAMAVFSRRFILGIGTAALLTTPLATVPLVAEAQISVMRSQARNITKSISRQVQKAIRPTLRVSSGAAGGVVDLNLSADGRTIVTILEDGSVRVWDLGDGAERFKLSLAGARAQSVQVGPKGKRAYVGSSAGQVHIFDLSNGRPLGVLGERGGALTSIAQSIDGKFLVTGAKTGSVQIWDLSSGERVRSVSAEVGEVTAVATAGNGRLLAAGGKDGLAQVWSFGSRSPIRVAKHGSAVIDLTFTPDGKRLVTGSDDRVIRVWEVTGSAKPRSFSAQGGSVLSVSVSRQGQFVVSGGDDNIIRLWDLNSGRLVRAFEGHQAPVRAVVFDLGEKRIISASDDGTTRVWDVESGAAFAQVISTVAGWAVVDKEGRFDGSEKGLDGIDWAAAEMDTPINAFSERYYEPGLLAKHLTDNARFVNDDVKAVTEGYFPPPIASFVGGVSPNPDGQGRLQVAVRAEQTGGSVEGVRLFHNGKVVPATAIESDESDGQDARLVVYRVAAEPGQNAFEALGVGKSRIDGPSVKTVVNVAGGGPKPRLHVLVIGINDYAAPALKLDYGRADAVAIAKTLAKVHAQSFAEVIGYQLMDRKATRAGILDALSILERVRPQDTAVIFLAGHGVTVDKDWYFLPAEYSSSTFDAAMTRRLGISVDDLAEALARGKANRVMVALDTCYAGAATQGFKDFIDRKELRSLGQATGVHVLAATRADQEAYEFPALGQGLLTHTLIMGASGKADTSRDGLISARELIEYSSTHLPAIARELYPSITQSPVAFSRGEDFALLQPRR
jgi:WD40 repeat protein